MMGCPKGSETYGTAQTYISSNVKGDSSTDQLPYEYTPLPTSSSIREARFIETIISLSLHAVDLNEDHKPIGCVRYMKLWSCALLACADHNQPDQDGKAPIDLSMPPASAMPNIHTLVGLNTYASRPISPGTIMSTQRKHEHILDIVDHARSESYSSSIHTPDNITDADSRAHSRRPQRDPY